MKRVKLTDDNPRLTILSGWMVIAIPLMMLSGVVYLFYHAIKCIDGCGPYHNTTIVADLDSDGDIDVVLSSLRHETETIFWAGSTLLINEGSGSFIPQRVEFGGPSTAVGDVDGDGDADIVQMDYGATIFLNQGGEQGGRPGDFRRWNSITPLQNPHNWSTPGHVVLGDLNNDGRLDAIVSYCCSMLIERQELGNDLLPFLPFVWINTADDQGHPMTHSYNLTSLGDLPMRPTLGDLNGDGYLDVFVATLPPKGGDYITADRVLFNDGSGNFFDSGQRLENPRLAGAAGSGDVGLGDLDGDGDLDALVSRAEGAAIWINQGGVQRGQAGVFADSGQRIGRGPIEAVFLADLDADGAPDALVGGKAGASIWWNDGQASFHDSKQQLRYTERHGLGIGDFNGDTYLDVFSSINEEIHLWLNQGDGLLKEEK